MKNENTKKSKIFGAPKTNSFRGFLKETSRDFLAIASPVFFALVLVRVSLLSNLEYLMQFVFAGILFFILVYFFKSNRYSGLGLIMLFFTIIFYNNLKFSIFAILVYFGLIASLLYLKEEKNKIFKGFAFGVISSVVSYFAVGFIF